MFTPFSTAIELSDGVRHQDWSIVKIVRSTYEQIDRLNPELNCFTRLYRQRAVERAEQMHAAIMDGAQVRGLTGVPLATKDLFAVRGYSNHAGSKLLADAPAEAEDAVVIRQLETAGAILTGSLNMDEFAYGFVTENAHYGTTRNPHDMSRLAGGSSGGSAAAVAAGMVPIALGSDTNGSVRVPASLCGVFGLRPTHGAVSVEGVFPFVERLDTVGIFTRDIDDMELAFSSLNCSESNFVCPPELSIGVLQGWFHQGANASDLQQVEVLASALGRMTPLDLEHSAIGRSSAFLITAAEGGCRHLDALRKDADAFDPATRDRLLAGALWAEEAMNVAEAGAALCISEIEAALEEFDILMALSTPTHAPRIDDGLIEINGTKVSARANIGLFTQPLSLAGVPILSVPLKRNEGDLPIGVQLVASKGNEALLFAAARQLVKLKLCEFKPPSLFEGMS